MLLEFWRRPLADLSSPLYVVIALAFLFFFFYFYFFGN